MSGIASKAINTSRTICVMANPAVSYVCPRGLVDNATPIIINGIHYGNFFTGQFFLEKPDMKFFKAQAKKYGFKEIENNKGTIYDADAVVACLKLFHEKGYKLE